VQLITSRHSFDRPDLSAFNLSYWHETAINNLAVDEHRASATLTLAAAFFVPVRCN
jgi:hypothetical protein